MQPLDAVGNLARIIRAEFHHQQRRRAALHGGHVVLQCQVFARQVEDHLVQDLDGGRCKFKTGGYGVQCRLQGSEVRHQQAAYARPRQQTHFHFGDDRQGAFTADQERYQPLGCLAVCRRKLVGQDIQAVAADASQDAWKTPANFRAVLRDNVACLAIKRALEPAVRLMLLPLPCACRGKFCARAVGQDRAQTLDVVYRLAVDDGARAGGVVADHAAQVGPACGCYIGTELQVMGGQGAIELVEHHAGLNARAARCRIDRQNLVEILAAVQDNARTNGLPGKTGSAAAGRNGNAHLSGNLHGDDNVLHGARDHHAQRFDLVNAGIRAVKLPRTGVKAHFAA